MTKQNEEPDKSNHEAKQITTDTPLPNNADYSRPETDTRFRKTTTNLEIQNQNSET
jgi:hypothetical protein